MSRAISRMMLVVAVVCGMAVASQAGQTTTSTQTTKSFEVLSVQGGQLVVKLPEGTRELTVPDDFRFTVDGKQLALAELKPGMKGTATITTRTTVTPVTVTEVKNGTVMQATGASVLVKTDEGFKNFTQGDLDKRGVKIMRDGQAVELSSLRKDDRLTATIITSKPPRVLTEKEVNASLAGAGAPAAAAAGGAGAPPAGSKPAATTGAAAGAGAGAEAAPAAPARKLPKTASSWPLLGLASALMIVLALGLTLRRRFEV
jgi:LPXTG-motif cell wall-anchored protein